MGENLLIGIDLGTTSIKCLVVDTAGNQIFFNAAEYETHSPQPGFAEQDPETWYGVTCSLLKEAAEVLGKRSKTLAGMAFSGQMHGMVLLGKQGNALRPAVIWADQRSAEQVKRINQTLTPQELAVLTGNPVAAGFMLPSLLWVRENETGIFRDVRHVLLPKDYLRYRFSGILQAEPSDASSTSLFDPALQNWSRGILDLFKISPAVLPEVGASTAFAGRINRETAKNCGLPEGLPIFSGASDQACQALGNGIIREGHLSSTIGTGGQIFSPVNRPDYDEELRLHLFCHALPDLWHYESAILAAGLSLKWLRDQVLASFSYRELADMASEIPAGSEGLLFMPYLAGERTPWMDPLASGGFIGLTIRHNRAHMVRALMEGVVFALYQGVEIIQNKGVKPEKMIVSGGAVKHKLWLQLQADIYNLPVCRSETNEAAASGAAILAGVGTGVFTDIPQACASLARYSPDMVLPDPERVLVYQKLYQIYKELYPSLKDKMTRIKNL